MARQTTISLNCGLPGHHSATHRTLTGEVSPQFHWRLVWSRSECITVAQLRTGHSPLLASYLHRIGRQQSPLCPHCGGDNETAQHLLLCCPTHMQARTSTNYIDSTDPRRMMSFLETIGAVTCPPRLGERERPCIKYQPVKILHKQFPKFTGATWTDSRTVGHTCILIYTQKCTHI